MGVGRNQIFVTDMNKRLSPNFGSHIMLSPAQCSTSRAAKKSRDTVHNVRRRSGIVPRLAFICAGRRVAFGVNCQSSVTPVGVTSRCDLGRSSAGVFSLGA